MHTLISPLPHTATALEIVRWLTAITAVSVVIAPLRRAARYYLHRLEAEPAGDADIAEDRDFLLVDLRLEVALLTACLFLAYSATVALFLPPPQGLSPANLASTSVNLAAIGVTAVIITIKMLNRQNRQRIYTRIDRRLAGMTVDRARQITRDERHELKNELQKREGTIYAQGREVDALVRRVYLLERRLREMGVSLPETDAEDAGGGGR